MEMLGAFMGKEMTADDFIELGKRILKMERDFNARAGFTSRDDRLPKFFRTEPLPPHNITFQVKDEDLDKVFNW
jgi:aldehyde:ferredoxin oxidoreductase